MVIKIAKAKANTAESLITLFLGYLSDKYPAGVKSRTKGRRISAFTTAVRMIWVVPEKYLKTVFWIRILCPSSLKAFKNTIKI
jgi:hypothetical protein